MGLSPAVQTGGASPWWPQSGAPSGGWRPGGCGETWGPSAETRPGWSCRGWTGASPAGRGRGASTGQGGSLRGSGGAAGRATSSARSSGTNVSSWSTGAESRVVAWGIICSNPLRARKTIASWSMMLLLTWRNASGGRDWTELWCEFSVLCDHWSWADQTLLIICCQTGYSGDYPDQTQRFI